MSELNDLIDSLSLEDYDEYTILKNACELNLNFQDEYESTFISDGRKRYKRYIMNIKWGSFEYIEQDLIFWLNLPENSYEQLKYKFKKMNEIDKTLFEIVCFFLTGQ